MSIETKVRQIIKHLLAPRGCDAESFDKLEDLQMDSLDHIELIMAMEEEFNIEIPDDTAESFKTVGDIVEFIKVSQS